MMTSTDPKEPRWLNKILKDEHIPAFFDTYISKQFNRIKFAPKSVSIKNAYCIYMMWSPA